MTKCHPGILFVLLILTGSAHAQGGDSLNQRHFQIRFAAGISVAATEGQYAQFLTRQGYNVYNPDYPFYSENEDRIARGTGMTAIAEYFLKPRFAVGVAFATLGSIIGSKAHVSGENYDYIPSSSSYPIYLSEEHVDEGCFLIATFVPYILKNSFSDFTVLLSGGIGFDNIDITYNANQYWYSEGIPVQRKIRKTSFGLYGLASLEQEVFEHLGMGACIEYRFMPVQTIDPFQLHIADLSGGGPYDVQVPGHSINFSDWKICLIASLHF